MIKNKSFRSVNKASQWQSVKISEVTCENISSLIETLTSQQLDDFFVAFNSLSKIGNKADTLLKKAAKKLRKNNWRKLAFNYLLNDSKNSNTSIVSRLYHPDFIKRVRAIQFIAKSSLSKEYFAYIIPLLNDPDDSVRWAVLKFLVNQNYLNIKETQERLMDHVECEKNPIIKKKILEILKK